MIQSVALQICESGQAVRNPKDNVGEMTFGHARLKTKLVEQISGYMMRARSRNDICDFMEQRADSPPLAGQMPEARSTRKFEK